MHSLVSNDQLSSSEFTGKNNKNYFPISISCFFFVLELPSQLASPTVKKHSILISDHHQQMLNELQQTRREPQFCDHALIFLSYVLFVIGMPFSLCLSIRIVPEYQRAVIFRLGRILQGGAKGPGLIFVLPCLGSPQLPSKPIKTLILSLFRQSSHCRSSYHHIQRATSRDTHQRLCNCQRVILFFYYKVSI